MNLSDMKSGGKKLNVIVKRGKSMIPPKVEKPYEDEEKSIEEKIGRKSESKFVTSFLSRAGDSTLNSDYFAYIELENYGCWVMADGYDEDKGSEEASRIVVEEVIENFLKNPKYTKRYLKKIIKKANEKLNHERLKSREYRGMNSSIAVLLTDYTSVIFGTVGNCRVNIIKDEIIREKSRDNSISYLMYETGQLSYSELRFHNQRNKLTQTLGDEEGIKVGVSSKIDLLDGDKVLMMTHGAWEKLDESDIEVELSRSERVGQWISGLEKRIKNGSAKIENYTLVGVFIDKIALVPKKKMNFNWVKLLGIVAIILFLGLGLYKGYSLKKERENIYEKAFLYENQGMRQIQEEEIDKAIESFSLSKGKYKELEVNPSSNIFYRTIFSPKITNINLGKQITLVDKKIEQIEILQELMNDFQIGDKSYKSNEFIEAENNFEEARTKLPQLKDLKYPKIKELSNKLDELILACQGLEIGKTLKLDGDLLANNRDTEEALRNYSEAKIIFLKYDKIDLVAETTDKINALSKERERKYNLGTMYEKRGIELESKDISGAIVYYEMAKGIFGELKDEIRRQELSDKVVKLDELRKLLRKESIGYINTAKAYSDTGDYEKSLSVLKKSQDISVQLRDNQLMVNGLEKEGDIFFDNKKYVLAEKKYKEAYGVVVNTNNDVQQKEIKEKTKLLNTIVSSKKLEKKGDKLFEDKKYKEARVEFKLAMEKVKKIEKNRYLTKEKYDDLLKEIEKKEKKAWVESNWIPFF